LQQAQATAEDMNKLLRARAKAIAATFDQLTKDHSTFANLDQGYRIFAYFPQFTFSPSFKPIRCVCVCVRACVCATCQRSSLREAAISFELMRKTSLEEFGSVRERVFEASITASKDLSADVAKRLQFLDSTERGLSKEVRPGSEIRCTCLSHFSLSEKVGFFFSLLYRCCTRCWTRKIVSGKRGSSLNARPRES
jgi:hypothetical protein